MGRGSWDSLVWTTLGTALVATCAILAWWSPAFGYDVAVRDMPVLRLVALSGLAGAVYLLVLPLLKRSAGDRRRPALLAWIVLAGLAMRLVFVGSEPVLEDDYQRYLWDGAVAANGLDPYAYAPVLALVPDRVPEEMVRLAEEAGSIHARINYPHLRTIYPPVAQAAFALAHRLAPWNLDAWRIVIIACDLAVAGFIVMLLRTLACPLPYLALYWWNPLVARELANSAHMDAIAMVPVLAATLLAVRGRTVLAGIVDAIGFGAKLWPVVLLPTMLRARGLAWPTIAQTALLTVALCALFAWPVVRASLDAGSGFVAYGAGWQANDALFRVVEWLALGVTSLFGGDADAGRLLARACVVVMLGAVMLWTNRTPWDTPRECARRVFVTIAALFLLSPTQFPWYFCWLAPFLPLFPVRGFLLLTVTLPLYYLYFHFAARGLDAWFHNGVVFAMWLPVWTLLALDLLRHGTITPAAAPASPSERP